MAAFFDAITDKQADFIARQPMFFVATAAADGRINLSPKGLAETFRVLGPDRVAYLDLGGSGNETQAHLRADGRITLMFCAFENPALILRLYGTGTFVGVDDPGFTELSDLFPALPGRRQVFVIDVESVQESCGWGVPTMTLDRQRETLPKYFAGVDPAVRLEKISHRTQSIDGLPVTPQKVWLPHD